MNKVNTYEAIIIGGSFAGLSAAMALGRALRKVLVIDNGKPCNASTPNSHNFLTQDGRKPFEILEVAKNQVAAYSTVTQVNGLVVAIEKIEELWYVKTNSEEEYQCKKLIFSSGLKDLLYDEPGFKECWGKTIIHCPYCHGYEFANQPTFILANADIAFDMVKLLSNWSKEITILTNGVPQFTEVQMQAFQRHNVKIIDKEIVSYQHKEGLLNSITFTNGKVIEANVLYARPPYDQHCQIPKELGCEITELGLIKIDPFLKTTINSIFACGDCTTLMRSVANSVAMGSLAGIVVNKELTEAEF